MSKLIREPFTRTRLDEERAKDKSKVVPIRLNVEELRALTDAGLILEQEKISSVIKTLMNLGLIAIHKQETAYLIDSVFKNKRNNKRTGITLVEPKFERM